MLAILNSLGIKLSDSRPCVSDDKGYAEALFGIVKYRPPFSPRGLGSLTQARFWDRGFVRWHDTEHTPS